MIGSVTQYLDPRRNRTPGPNTMEVFGPPVKYLTPYTSIQAQAQFPTLTLPPNPKSNPKPSCEGS